MQQSNLIAGASPQRAPLPGFPALAFSALFLLAGAYFGSTKNFGAFLFSIPILSLTFLGALVATAWTTCIRAQRRYALAASVMIGLTVPVYFLSYNVAQHVRFLLWAPLHYHLMAQASAKDGIIMGWDGWGFAGSDTESYLVVDNNDRLRSKVRADQWSKEIGQTCGLWQAQRMWPRFYVVTTYTNCPYDGVKPAK